MRHGRKQRRTLLGLCWFPVSDHGSMALFEFMAAHDIPGFGEVVRELRKSLLMSVPKHISIVFDVVDVMDGGMLAISPSIFSRCLVVLVGL